jgi:hypothetical protein
VETEMNLPLIAGLVVLLVVIFLVNKAQKKK